MAKPTISLCMIVKNLDDNVFRETLKNLKPQVDEIIVVTDDEDYKRPHGYWSSGLAPLVSFIDYKWNDDFAEARNLSFDKATSDYIFWIDADDVVIHPEKLPELAEAMQSNGIDWCHMEYLYEKDEHGRVRMRQWKPRLTRRGTGIWKKSVHEVYEPTTQVTQMLDEEIKIDHQHIGELHTIESGKRNLAILLREYEQDGEATDPRTLYYLGNTFMAMSNWADAIPFYTKHIKKCGWPEEKYFSMHYLCHCYKEVGQTDLALNIALEMTKIFPQWSLAYFDLAEFYSHQDDYKRVIEWTLVGLSKQKPDSKAYFTSDLDYTVFPMLRLAQAYILDGDYEKALHIGERLAEENPEDKLCLEMRDMAREAYALERFVTSFITVAMAISNKDRIKASKLFECLPSSLDQDARIQGVRQRLVPPKNWASNSVVIYCGKGQGGEWAQPSILTGIGGSEEAVINMGEQLTKLGYEVTVYNHCGDFRGKYAGVDYVPYYHFNPKDNFATLISWRTPGLFELDLKAKKKLLWLHDISYPEHFNQKIIDSCDKIIFLSKWHRSNLPDVPEEKVFISNNGINPKDFENLPAKEPNTLLWSSSYDRGLLPFIKNILPLIKKEIPDVVLHVAYGWNNIDKLITEQPGIYPDIEALRAELGPILDNTPGIVHHGRIGHKQLAQLMGKCMVYPYASEFGETNNITSQKMQAAGCYVVTTSQAGGTPERVRFGQVIPGNDIYLNEELQKKFAQTVVGWLEGFQPSKWSTHPNRPRDVLDEFSWEETAKTWQKGLL